MKGQKLDVKDRVIARMNALARAVEIGLHRELSVEQMLELGERLYEWVMEPANGSGNGSTDNSGSSSNSSAKASNRPASEKQIAFIKRLLKNASEETRNRVEERLNKGVTSQEASKIIEMLKKEGQK